MQGGDSHHILIHLAYLAYAKEMTQRITGDCQSFN